MTKTAETQINTALALAQLVQSKDAGRGCRLSAERAKALWHFISLVTQTSEPKASADTNGSETLEMQEYGHGVPAGDKKSTDATDGAKDLLAATGEVAP